VTPLNLPDHRTITLDDSTTGLLRASVVCLDDVAVAENPAVWDETEALGAELRRRYSGLAPAEIPGLRPARELYRAFGMDFTRHRPSSEALLRRVLRDKALYRINNAVDCCNLASLRFLLPIGMYDRDRIVGDITLRVGRDGEEYAGIRKGPVHLAGRLGLFDRDGGFGSPTSDSARTCVTDATTRLLAVIMAPPIVPVDELADHGRHFAELFARHCGATLSTGGILEA
jgi:DNA/RNA-binding domain of Phe-tRNA-synthetase-like protein